MSRIRFGLQSRLILLLFLAIVPTVGLLLYSALDSRRQARANVEAEELRLTQLVAEGQLQILDSTRQVLDAVSHLAEISSGNQSDCQNILADLLQRNTYYTNLVVLDANGRLVCSGRPVADVAALIRQPWFARVLATGTYTVGEYQFEPVEGRSVVYVANLKASGSRTLVVAAAIDLAWMNSVAAKAQLPAGGIVAVTDREGTLLVRYPDPDTWIGQHATHAASLAKARETHASGMFTERADDGVERIFAYTALAGTLDAPQAAVAIGLPRQIAFGPADQMFAFNLGALVLVVGLAGIAIWLGGQWLIVRPATRLAFVTSQLAAGELQARSQLTYNSGELGQLASAVDRMAAGLHIQTEALRQSEERYRIIAGLIADYAVAVRFNADGQAAREWTSGDPVRLTGYTADELDRLGGWIATIHPEDRAVALDIQQPHAHTEVVENEFRIVAKDGTTRWVHVYRQYDWAHQGTRLTHCYDAINDVTERKHAEAHRLDNERQLQESQRLESLGLLAGGIAHDFNNLLMTISGNAQMIQMQVGDNHPAYAMLDQVVVAVRRAADLTTQMLAYAGKGRIVVERINLHGLVSEMAELLTTSLPKHVRLVYDLAQDPVVIEGDATQMRQVVMNLIINAGESIEAAAGLVTLTTHTVWVVEGALAGAPGIVPVNGDEAEPGLADGAYVALTVTDNGRGMDEQTLARIFEPFFTTKFTGRGLGLSAVQGIVRGHRGALSVRSKPGYGTTFQVLLPLVDEVVPFAEATMLDGTAWITNGTVMVVDDDPAVRDIAARMLGVFGLNVVVAESGTAALDYLRNAPEPLTAVLLDMVMPPPDGVETFRLMRAMRPNLSIIIASGYSSQEIASRFEHSMPSGFIQKPFTLDNMRVALRALMEREHAAT